MASVINSSTSAGVTITPDTSGVLQLQTASTAAVTIDASQNVGIGTSSPAAKLHVESSSAADLVEILKSTDAVNGRSVIYMASAKNSAGTQSNISMEAQSVSAANADLVFRTNGSNVTAGTEQMRITSAGNVGIGTSSPTQQLNFTGNALTSGWYRGGAGTAANPTFTVDGNTGMYRASSGDIAFSTSNAERMRIESGGNVVIGKTATGITTVGIQLLGNGNSGYTMAASTSAASTFDLYSTGASAYRFYVTLDGKIWCTSTSISGISDERLKENIRDLDTGIDAIMAVKPRRFDWKDGKGQNKKNAVGFVAQEFETVFPDSVMEGKAGEDGIQYKTVCHEELIPAMVKAMQEQQALITDLTTRLAALEGAK